MNEQDALLPDENGMTTPTPFNPAKHGMWRSVVGVDGRINPEKWDLAIRNGQFVGTCKRCGDYLIPRKPEENAGRIDYEAVCKNEEIGTAVRKGVTVVIPCTYTMVAVGGRTFAGTSRTSRKA